jgi:transposase-like protein
MSNIAQRRLARIGNQLRQASGGEIVQIELLLAEIASEKFSEVSLAKRQEFCLNKRTCPHCKTEGARLHGKDKNKRQRFKCLGKECGRTFNTLTGTALARARKPEKWGRYLSCMTSFLSVRSVAKSGIGVNHTTIWRWRHRFLKAAANENAPVLSGVIEADETFFLRSFKGHRGWTKGKPPANRAARPRAWGALKRGLSQDQVPVLTALDNAGGLYERVLASLTDIEACLDGRIAKNSVICSDDATAYVRAAMTAGAEHRRVMLSKITPQAVKRNPVPTQRRRGKLGLGNVNALHGQLKSLINIRCRGVATRYLDSYLGWHRAMRQGGFDGKALLGKALV